jgi:threonine aldolase
MDGAAFAAACQERSVHLYHRGGNRFRVVTHHDVSQADVEKALRVMRAVLGGKG